MGLISTLLAALAPTTAKGRHEESWRPLPPSRSVRSRSEPAISAQLGSTIGIVTALTLVGSMVAVASPGEPEPDFTTSTVLARDTTPILVDPTLEFVLPREASSVPQTSSTMEDLSFTIARRETTTTATPVPITAPTPTTAAPSAEERDALQAAELERDKRVESMSAVGFEPEAVVVVEQAEIPRPEAASVEECKKRAGEIHLTPGGRWDRNAIAQMTWSVFDCVLSVHGLDEVAPTGTRSWNGRRVGFENLAEQMGAEAVVVSYCESVGYRHDALIGSNGFGYAGLFQMGTKEMGLFGAGGSRFDPVDSAFGAANYVWSQYVNRDGYGGWAPWAVVNTGFDDEVNNQVKVPILPRFRSVDPEFAGQRGPELPAWAIDPWSHDVPAWNGCPYNGGRW